MTQGAKNQISRALRAVAVVVAIVASIPLIDFIGRAVRLGSMAYEVSSGAGSEESLQLEGVALGEAQGSDAVPVSFQQETFSFEALDCVRCSVNSGVTSFLMQGSSGDAFASVSEWLKASGWSCIESGQENMASFVKKDGRYRWLFVSCVATGSQVTVVLQCEEFYDEG